MAGAREPTGLGTERMPSGSDGPELGAQFAQLVKELRSEYAGAVTACAARIAQGVFGPSGRSILRILEQHGITGTPTLMQQQASLLSQLAQVVTLHLCMHVVSVGNVAHVSLISPTRATCRRLPAPGLWCRKTTRCWHPVCSS